MMILKNFSVLCVEDDTDALESICTMLKELTKEVYCAKNGMQGLELYKKRDQA